MILPFVLNQSLWAFCHVSMLHTVIFSEVFDKYLLHSIEFWKRPNMNYDIFISSALNHSYNNDKFLVCYKSYSFSFFTERRNYLITILYSD